MHDKIRIAAIVGMEQCNQRVWREVTSKIADYADLTQWTDQDLEHQNPEAAEAIQCRLYFHDPHPVQRPG